MDNDYTVVSKFLYVIAFIVKQGKPTFRGCVLILFVKSAKQDVAVFKHADAAAP
ncbi:hypothetical protein D3C84_1223230 [compost metagenome]